jgi:Peptidase A4 family
MPESSVEHYRVGTSLEPIGHTLMPGIHTALAIQAIPDAVCWVHVDGDNDPAHRLRVYADDKGIARFSARPAGQWKEVGTLVIDAVKDGLAARQPLMLRSDQLPAPDMPHPPVDIPNLSHGAPTRPGLTRGEALAMTPQGALDGHYPMPPDREHAPAAFEHWLRIVSQPMTVIEPRLIQSSDVSHGKAAGPRSNESKAGAEAGAATRYNWSGSELLRSVILIPGPHGLVEFKYSDPYDWITGSWHVPTVTGELWKKANSAYWVGLDGDNLTDLVQAGTEQDGITVQLWGELELSTYYAWTEFLPQQPLEQVIQNLPIRAGDEIYTEVWMGSAGGDLSLTGPYGRFLVMNLTTGQVGPVFTPRGSTRVGGTEAVWIMERPTVNGAYSDLANYGSTTMYNVVARRINSARHQGYIGFQTGATQNDTMVNLAGTEVLSTVTPIDSASMRFDWQAFS